MRKIICVLIAITMFVSCTTVSFAAVTNQTYGFKCVGYEKYPNINETVVFDNGIVSIVADRLVYPQGNNFYDRSVYVELHITNKSNREYTIYSNQMSVNNLEVKINFWVSVNPNDDQFFTLSIPYDKWNMCDTLFEIGLNFSIYDGTLFNHPIVMSDEETIYTDAINTISKLDIERKNISSNLTHRIDSVSFYELTIGDTLYVDIINNSSKPIFVYGGREYKSCIVYPKKYAILEFSAYYGDVSLNVEYLDGSKFWDTALPF